jgi:hypothetical protein
MFTDINLRVSTNQAITSTAVSTDKVDLGTNRDIGEGENLYMNFAVPTALTGGTSVNFEVVVADDAALTTNVTVIGASGAIAAASLVTGFNTAVRLQPQFGSLGRRYLGARYTVVGTFGAGTVTADIVHDVQDGRKFYPGGFTVQ